MANPEHLAILRAGVKEWNQWRDRHPEIERPDLTSANLDGANLFRANLSKADLIGSTLDRADLQEAGLAHAALYAASLNSARLDGADLREANMGGADLYEANLSYVRLMGGDLQGASLGAAVLYSADLEAANLRETKLGGAHFTAARLHRTNFEHAEASGVVFADVDFSTAEHLDSVKHYGPSFLSIDTIYKSKGKIPEVFLRGCGVPEEFIAYIGSMVGRPIEYYSCFISYSTKDQAFADRLYADLQAKGVRCWFAPHDIMGGRKIHEQIDEAIRVHDKLLLILSEHSMASDWVGTEIANARELEAREKKQMLFPITIAPFEEVKKWKKFDADRGTDSAREIREYYIPDFSEWERDAAGYQREFEKLVGALKAVDSG